MKPKIVRKKIFEDTRGFFVENFKDRDFSEKFIQDNLSYSKYKGTVRGMHFQIGEYAQTKLVTVLKGKILDVVMNLQTEEIFSYELCAKELDSLLVPNNYAHGFMTLENDTLVSYKVDNYYKQESEGSINWRDDIFQDIWPEFEEYFLSEKDQDAPYYKKL
jgi:dTDP-4-dehydrorhamnose 3,5-epimerase